MSNKRKVEHKILGEVLLSFNDEGRPEYDYGTLSNIFSKAIEFLYSKDLLSEAEKKAVYRVTRHNKAAQKSHNKIALKSE